MDIQIITDNLFNVNSYLINENGHAIIIDPIVNKDLLRKTDGLQVDFAILTHEHFDHIRGVNDFKQTFEAPVLCGEYAEDGLRNPAVNLSRYTDYLSAIIPFCNCKSNNQEYKCNADELLKDGQSMEWLGHTLLVKYTPGHSVGSIAIVIDGEMIFSGDTIFCEYPTALRMPGGNAKRFKEVTIPWIESLRQDIMVYPGHTKPFYLKDRYK